MDLVFTNVSERMPDCKGSPVRVYIKKPNGSTSKGMFFMNGTNPTFASYGSEVQDVIAWAYWK